MTGASSLAYPGGKTLAGWWRQLQGASPRALWVGYLFVHRVEALVETVRQRPLDRFAHLVLEGLQLQPSGLPGLPLGPALTGQLLRGLARDGLVRGNGETWTLTEVGQQALATGNFSSPGQERRLFTFVEHVDSACQRLGQPRFLPLGSGPAIAWLAKDPYRLDVAWLRECLQRPATWKEAAGFSLEVKTLLEPNWAGNGQVAPEAPPWQRVLLDRPERLLMGFFTTGHEPEWLVGCAVRPEGWSLYTADPILRVPAQVAQEMIPALAPSPISVWRTAWAAWCAARHLPAEDIHDCKVTIEGARLRVIAPAVLLQRLRAARSDIFKGETWLLAGEGHIRAAAVVEIAEATG